MIATTLVVGASLLATTLAVNSAGALFYGLGIATGVVWVAGSVLAGPLPWVRCAQPRAVVLEVAMGLAAGAGAFLLFLAARHVASLIPVLDRSVSGILDRADAGSQWAVLATALASGVGEEVFFRGGLYEVLPKHSRVWLSVVLYAAVTVTTWHVALVIAAMVMGVVFSVARIMSRGLLVPIVLHVSWSTLMLFFLPR